MIINPSFGGGEDCKLPAGGAAGQVLTKKSAADNDAEWKDVPKPDGIPSGFIGMWSGAVNAIPAGWLLCNGQNGTPDLRDRFIVGAVSGYSVGATGGSNTVTLTVEQMPAHYHKYLLNNYSYFMAANGALARSVGDAGNTTDYAGGNQPHENRPPYYALCFIMKQ